jgi:hypothetical protein
MKTVVENLQEFAHQIKALLTELIQNHSEIYRWNTPGDGLIVLTGNFAWRDLKLEGKEIKLRSWGRATVNA